MLHSRGEADFDLYPYTPSASAGYAFLALFAIGGFMHLVMLFPLRSWFFIPFVLGCAGESLAYHIFPTIHHIISEHLLNIY